MTNYLSVLPHHRVLISQEAKEEYRAIKLEMSQRRGFVAQILYPNKAFNCEIATPPKAFVSAQDFAELSRLSCQAREQEFLKNFSLRLIRHPHGLFRLHINPRLFGGGNGCSGGHSKDVAVSIPVVPQSQRPTAARAIKASAPTYSSAPRSPIFFGCDLVPVEKSRVTFEQIEQVHSTQDVALFLKTSTLEKPEYLQLIKLASNIIEVYRSKNNKTKEHTLEVVALAEAENPLITKELIKALTEEYEKSEFLELYILQALKKALLFAPQDALDPDDLVRILSITFKQFNKLHKQESTSDKLHATLLSLGELLDLMGDADVKDVKRVELHDAFYRELDTLSSHTELRIASAAAYALQSLVRVPNDESKLMSCIRRGIAAGKTIKNLYDVVAKKDPSFLLDAYTNAKEAYHSQEDKKPWHDEARMSLALIYFGKWKTFEDLIIARGKETKHPHMAGCIASLIKGALSQKQSKEVQTGCILLLKDIILNENRWSCYQSDRIKIARDKIQKENEWGALILNTDDRMVKKGVLKHLVYFAGDSNDHIREESRKCLLDLKNLIKQGPLQDLMNEEVTDVSAIPIRIPSLQNQTDSNELFTLSRRGGFLSVTQKIQNIQSLALKNSDVLQDLSTHVAALGSSQIFSESVADFDLQEKVCSFVVSSKKTFLLVAESGGGKTFALRALEKKLWEEWASGKPIPLFISLAASNRPFNGLIEETLENKGFSAQEIKDLKNDLSFIFLLDGYDELNQLKNLYIKNDLRGWNAKAIISCRKQYLAEIGSGYRSLFYSTQSEKAAQESFEECLIRPFTKSQVEGFFQEKTGQAAAYDSMKKIPGLLDLLENPFLLKLASEILPELQKRFGAEEENNRSLMRIDLYDEFTNKWFYKSKSRLIEAGNPLILNGASSIGHAEGIFDDFCKELAAEMFLSGKAIVEYKAKRPLFSSHALASNPWERFFGNYNADIRNAIPLVFDGSYTYAFLHKSLLEYFGAKALIENETNFKLGSRLLTSEHELLKFLAEHAQRDASFEQKLMDNILETREKSDNGSLNAAANSITILNKAGVSFSRRDLSYIQVPKADLRGAIFYAANLKGANLQECAASQASFDFADLSEANLSKIDSGILPPFVAHLFTIKKITFSKDKTILISQSHEAIIAWDLKKNEKLQKWEGKNEFYLSPTGHELLLEDDDSLVAWNLDTNQQIYSLPYKEEASPCFSCSGEYFLIPYDEESISQIDTRTGKLITTFKFNPEFIGDSTWALLENDKVLYCHSLAYSIKMSAGKIKGWGLSRYWLETSLFQKGQKNLYGHCIGKKTIQIFKSLKGDPFLELKHTGKIIEWIFSKDESLVLSKDSDHRVYVWDLKTGKKIFTIENVDSELDQDSLFSNQKRLALAHQDCVIRIWDLETKKTVKAFVGSKSTSLKAIVSYDEKILFSSDQNNVIRRWSLSQLEEPNDPGSHTSLASSFLNLKGNLVTVTERGEIQIRQQKTGNIQYQLKTEIKFPTAVTESLDGSKIFAADKKRLLSICNVASGKIEQQTSLPYFVHTLFQLSNPDQLFIVTKFGEAIIWDWKKQICVHSFLEKKSLTSACTLSQDQKILAVSCVNGHLHLLDIENKKLLYTKDIKAVSSIVITSRGLVLAAGQTIEIRDLMQGTLDVSFECEHSPITNLAYCAKIQMLAIGDSSGEIHIYDLKENSHLFSINAHEGSVKTLDWNADCLLISSGKDNLIQYWDVRKNPTLVWRSNSPFSAKNTAIESCQNLDVLEKNMWIEQGAQEFSEKTLLAKLEQEDESFWKTKIDQFGNTRLHLICNQHAPKFWEKFVSKRSDINPLNDFNEGLIHQILLSKNLNDKEKISSLEMVLQLGVDLNQKDFSDRTPLFTACLRGLFRPFQFLAKKGADLNTPDYYKWTPAVALLGNGDVQCLKILADRGIDLDAVDMNGWTPAELASNTGHLRCLHFLAEIECDLSRAGKKGRTPVLAACSREQLECLEFLAMQGCDMNEADEEGNTPVNFVSYIGNLDCLKFLIEKRCDVNKSDAVGNTPAISASQEGHLECLKILAKSGADLHKANDKGRTCAWRASDNGHLKCLEFLAEQGAALDEPDEDGETPVMRACEIGHLDCLEFLAKRGCNLNSSNKKGWTPAIFAADSGHLKCLEFLAGQGCDLNLVDEEGQSAIMRTVYSCHQKCFEFLAEQGCNLNQTDTAGDTLAIMACVSSYLDCLKFLAEKKANLNTANKDGCNPAMMATHNGHPECLKFLAGEGCDLNASDKEGRTCAIFASQNGNLECLKFLADKGCDLNQTDKEGRTCAMFASQNGHLECLEFLADKGCDLNQTDKEGRTCAMFASQNGHLECLKFLADKGCDLNQADKDGFTCTKLASRDGRLECLKFLANRGCDLKSAGEKGFPCVMYASANGRDDCLKFLADEGCDLSASDQDGHTCAMTASRSGHLNCLKFLANRGCDLNASDQDGFTCTMRASQNGHLECLKFLEEMNCALDAKDNQGNTSAMFASVGGHLECLKFLADKGCDLNASAKDGFTCAMNACQKGHLECLKFLEEKKCALDAKDNNGSFPAMLASEGGHLECLKFLNEKGYDLNAANTDGLTCVMITCIHGHLECLKFLEEMKCDLSAKDKEGSTPAMIASEQGNLHCLKFLADKGCDLNQTDEEGFTCAMRASHNDHLECLKFLAEKNCNLDAKGNEGNTSAMFASERGNINCLKFLAEKKCNLEVSNSNGDTCALLASQNGHLECLKFLEEKKCNLDAKDNEGNTPTMLASEKGLIDCLKFLAEKKCNLNASDQNGFTPTMFAAQNDRLECLMFLANNGADLSKANSYGWTSAMLAADGGYLRCLEFLAGKKVSLDETDKSGMTPTMFASRNGHLNCLKFLAVQGCDLNAVDEEGSTCIMLASQDGHIKCIEFLLGAGCDLNVVDKEGKTCAIAASQGNHPDCLAFLADNGANLNTADKEGRTPAIFACGGGHHECLKVLVKKGIDINAISTGGIHASLFAAQNGYRNCLEILYENGANFNAVDANGSSAAMFACENGHDDCLKFLAEKGANLKARGMKERTLAILAAIYGHLNCLKFLEENGVDLKIADKDGKNPAMYASKNNHPECLQFLTEKGAGLNKSSGE